MACLDRHRGDPAQAPEVLAEIDRLAHLLHVLCLGAGKRARRLADVALAIRVGDEVLANHPALALHRDELKRVQHNLRDIYKRNQRIAKLLLFRINDAMTGAYSDVDTAAYSIEHILPRTPPARSEWRDWYSDAGQREAASCSIGNLLIAPKRINASAGNSVFSVKRAIYNAAEDFGPMRPSVEDVIAASSWRWRDIALREDKMLAAIGRIWQVDLGDASRLRRSVP
jgi:hypothetical protein